MPYYFSWRKNNKKVDDLLLYPEDPFLCGEEDALKSDSEGHGDGEEDVLVIDQGEEVR